MSISEALLSEFDQEVAKTRKTLERVPADKPEFAPHPKSMPMSMQAALRVNHPYGKSRPPKKALTGARRPGRTRFLNRSPGPARLSAGRSAASA